MTGTRYEIRDYLFVLYQYILSLSEGFVINIFSRRSRDSQPEADLSWFWSNDRRTAILPLAIPSLDTAGAHLT